MALESYFQQLSGRPPLQPVGQVVEANASYVGSLGPLVSVGDCCEIRDANGACHAAEVIGFRDQRVVSMPLSDGTGIRFGDRVVGLGKRPSLRVGDAMLGRVFNAAGDVIDGGPAPHLLASVPLERDAPSPLERSPIRSSLGCGVRAIDTMLTVARGQRVGIFGGSGVGKSTLIGMMTRNTAADMTVVGLVGERGREVGEFLEESLGEEGRRRSVVFVATGDQSPLMRLRAALAATATAEYFASTGKHVLLILDSLTRFAMAAREVGLAAGEPPSTKGYPPSVYARMARLLERAGSFQTGSVTAFYTVLMEGDDEQDPIVDSARSILDGHVLLSRELAMEGIYPPIDVLRSVSRLMPAVASDEHKADAGRARALLNAFEQNRDLLRVGAYKAGSDADFDQAVVMRPKLLALLRQSTDERTALDTNVAMLASLCASA